MHKKFRENVKKYNEEHPPINVSSMTDKEKKLAVLLASYEMDEPYDDNEEPSVDHFNWEKIEKELKEEHFGDCVSSPSPCLRCYLEPIIHKAQWINKNM